MLVNKNIFVEKIEDFHPKSLDYRKYWSEIKRRCIEGYWSGGVFCPPSLYFYLNLGTIWIKKTRNSKSQIKGRPRNLDYLWDRINYPWLEARGCSGFELLPNPTPEELRDVLYNGSKTGSLGKPLYNNDPKNMILMTNRGSGKTSWAANECAREFLTDAAREYIPGENTKAEIIVGAFDTKLSSVPIKILQLALNEIPGAQTINGIYYPSPLSKITSGSLLPSKDLEHLYPKKIGGKQIIAGTGSIIKHRTYGDSPFVAQGGRYTTKLAEEIGMWDNLLECHYADENQVIGNSKLGSTIYIGCVCAGTKVWTNEGKLVNIEDLKHEEGILGFGHDQISKEQITHFNPPAKKPCYRITTKVNTVLECSEDHPILWSKKGYTYADRANTKEKRVFKKSYKKVKFKETKDIKVGDQICLVNSINIFGQEKMWEPRLVGMLIGDGSYGFDKTPILSNCDSEINSYIDSKFNTVIEKSYLTKDNKLYRETRIKEICPKLRELGIYGQTKNNKTLPVDLHKYDKESICELIAGLIDTDGCVSISKTQRITIRLASSSESLLREVKYLCVKLGIHGNIHATIPDPEKEKYKKIKSVNPYYTYSINDDDSALNFYKNIKLLCKYKQNRLDLFPEIHKKRVRLSRKSNAIFTTKGTQEDKRLVTVSDIEGIRFETVKSIEYIGEKEVYNLTAGNTHTYLANNVITHNTGGDMKGKGTLAAYKMFYDPVAYNCVYINDEWENKGKIGIFISAVETKQEYKDDNGNTNKELGKQTELDIREQKKKAKDPGIYDEYIIYNPLVPSEIFLQKQNNVFPTAILSQRLSELETNSRKGKDSEYIGELVFSPELNKIIWRANKELRPIYDYPLLGKADSEGCIVIYEHPLETAYGEVDSDRYIASMDPYEHDQVVASDSLGCVLIFDRLQGKIVAEYTGRPLTLNEFYENARKLIKYYNATCLYENNKPGFKNYLDGKNELHLLLSTPKILDSITPDSKPVRKLGMTMLEKYKIYGVGLVNNWLRASAEIPDLPDITNAHRIRCIPLLKELLMYTPDMNADRVIALILLMYYLEEIKHFSYLESSEKPLQLSDSAFFNKPLFKK